MAKNRELKTRADGIKQHYNTGSSVTSTADARAAWNPRPAKKEEPVATLDPLGFGEDGTHGETGTLYDKHGLTRGGWDASGNHFDTGLRLNMFGRDQSGEEVVRTSYYSYENEDDGLNLDRYERARAWRLDGKQLGSEPEHVATVRAMVGEPQAFFDEVEDEKSNGLDDAAAFDAAFERLANDNAEVEFLYEDASGFDRQDAERARALLWWAWQRRGD